MSQTKDLIDVQSNNHCTHNKMEARKSTIPNAGNGLFATKRFVAGDFVGFYTGEEMDNQTLLRLPPGRLYYAMEIADGIHLVANPTVDIIANVNEPPQGKTANLIVLQYNLYPEYTNVAMATACAFYAASTIISGEEMFVHYGDKYEGHRKTLKYKVGNAAGRISVNKVKDPRTVLSEIPLNAFVALTLKEAKDLSHKKQVTQSKVSSGKPVGRPPINKVWDKDRNVYVVKGKTIKKTTQKGTGRPRGSKAQKGSGRPRGRPPNNKFWNGFEYV